MTRIRKSPTMTGPFAEVAQEFIQYKRSAVGLLLGIALCQFVVQTAEIDEVMFGRDIHAMSYVWSFLITVVFSLLVNLIMTKVLKKISMVESLKSVE